MPLKIFLFKTVKKKIKYVFRVYPVTAKFMKAALNIFFYWSIVDLQCFMLISSVQQMLSHPYVYILAHFLSC